MVKARPSLRDALAFVGGLLTLSRGTRNSALFIEFGSGVLSAIITFLLSTRYSALSTVSVRVAIASI
ncbi:MAG: hypothetical protein V7K26_20215 [Nostoc sp.]|uniref:hypothetical protein n=1 Tax=Nostoc sp. TaxID=1180 RepID=UPI002FF33C76